jgi:hypothetical protein
MGSASRYAYAVQAAASGGGARQRSLTSRRRFCAVAVSQAGVTTPSSVSPEQCEPNRKRMAREAMAKLAEGGW